MSGRPLGVGTTLGTRIVAVIKALPDHALIDRLLRGRAWIPVLGVMLAGIVAMQVSMLKLGASIGTSIQRGAALQSQNDQLRATVASLADEQRIERLAAAAGMSMPAPDGVSFLAVSPAADVHQAVAKMTAPNPSAIALVQSTTAAVTPPGAASAQSAGASPQSAGASPLSTSTGN